MAETPRDARTEAPSQRRREKARLEGQVALSAELNSSLALLAGVLALLLAGPMMAAVLLGGLQTDLRSLVVLDLTPTRVQAMFQDHALQALLIFGTIAGAVVAIGILANLLQVGWAPSPKLLAWKLERLSPARGLRRIFSITGLARGLYSIIKPVLIGVIAWWLLSSRMSDLMGAFGVSLWDVVTLGWEIALHLALSIALALTALGLADYGLQRWRHEQSLMMTRQEKKEELKEEEIDPQVKQRLRRLQRERAQNRMLAEVPKASVVITNPTHLAVALRYDQASMAAPKVVAKGAGKAAERIVAIARANRVAVVQKRLLARELFRNVRVGQEIPVALYRAVAAVLTYVYRLRGRMPRLAG